MTLHWPRALQSNRRLHRLQVPDPLAEQPMLPAQVVDGVRSWAVQQLGDLLQRDPQLPIGAHLVQTLHIASEYSRYPDADRAVGTTNPISS